LPAPGIFLKAASQPIMLASSCVLWHENGA
jgi:hypothetical protein